MHTPTPRAPLLTTFNLFLCAALLTLAACASPPPSTQSGNGIHLLKGEWSLLSIEGRRLPDALRRQPRPPGLAFASGGQVSGFGGVNHLSSTVDLNALDNGVVTFTPFTSTLMAGPVETMDVESRYLAALARVNRYVLDGPSLVLLDNKRELLRFQPPTRSID